MFFFFSEKNRRGARRRAYRGENRRGTPVAYRSDDGEIVVRSARGMPDAAGDECNFRDVPLRLPARSERAREIRVVRNDQDARGGQGIHNSFARLRTEVFPLLPCTKAGASC